MTKSQTCAPVTANIGHRYFEQFKRDDDELYRNAFPNERAEAAIRLTAMERRPYRILQLSP